MAHVGAARAAGRAWLIVLYKTLLSKWFYYNVLRLSMTEECAWLIDRERFR